MNVMLQAFVNFRNHYNRKKTQTVLTGIDW